MYLFGYLNVIKMMNSEAKRLLLIDTRLILINKTILILFVFDKKSTKFHCIEVLKNHMG